MALALGKTVGELEHTISHNELLEWVEYLDEKPLMVDRNELQMAQLSQMIAAYMGGKKNKTQMSDFMPSFKKVKKVKTDLAKKVKSLFGGT